MADPTIVDTVSRVAIELALNALWQGLVVAGVAFAGAYLLRRASAATRYVFWTAALASLVVLPAASSLARLAPQPVASPAARSAVGVGVDESAAVPVAAAAVETAPVTTTVARPAPLVEVRGGAWAPWALAALLVVWAARLGRVAAGMIRISGMRRRSRPLAPERVARLAGWSRLAGEGRRARLCVSPDARVPMVLGPIRPVIAIPEGLLDGLSNAELDQVALHELAHVRRRDDWAKLVQAVAEALCWFHPAARWIARRVDAEREVACDDWVLSVTRARRPYAMCLLKLAGLGLVSDAVPAPGAFGRKPMLSERIELVMKTNRNTRPTPSRLSRLSLAAALSGAALCCLASGPAVVLSALPIVELSPGDLPRDAASHSGPEPATAASRGALPTTDLALREETLAAIARDDARGEDPEARRVAIEALGDRAGAVLVLDPRTGRILAAINQDWVFRRGFAPASTIKLVTALAALEAGGFDPAARVAAQGKRVTLDQAIADSNNEYFQTIGERAGLERFLGVARAFGYGEATGTNYEGEYAGLLPASADPSVFSTGAGIEVTPAQLASVISAIANGGDLVAPRVARDGVFDHIVRDGAFERVVRRHVDVSPAALRRLLPGMIGTVKYGTGVNAADSQFAVAGKTGSAEGPEGKTGLFVSFAPAEKPTIAIVVVTRGSKTWGADAAAVAGYIYRALGGRVLC